MPPARCAMAGWRVRENPRQAAPDAAGADRPKSRRGRSDVLMATSQMRGEAECQRRLARPQQLAGFGRQPLGLECGPEDQVGIEQHRHGAPTGAAAPPNIESISAAKSVLHVGTDRPLAGKKAQHPQRRWRLQRHHTHHRLARLGDHELPPPRRLLDQPRQLSLRFVDVDSEGQGALWWTNPSGPSLADQRAAIGESLGASARRVHRPDRRDDVHPPALPRTTARWARRRTPRARAASPAMTLPIARDLARNGIRCMTIAPGIFCTR